MRKSVYLSLLGLVSLLAAWAVMACISAAGGQNARVLGASAAAQLGQASDTAGLLDAAAWPFGERDTYALEGPWRFYAGRLLAPGELAASGEAASGASADTPAAVSAYAPHVWGMSGGEGAPAAEGTGTYRLTVRFSPQEAGSLKALYLPGVASAYRLWINGAEAAKQGIAGADALSMKPASGARVVYFQARAGDNEVVLNVSNFSQRKGGLWAKPLLGSAAAVTAKRESRIASQLASAIPLFTLGLYHLGLFLVRKREGLSLLIGLVSLLLALRSLLLGDSLLSRFWPELPWEWTVKAEYLAPYLGVPLFAVIVRRLYPAETSLQAVRIIQTGSAVFIAVVLLYPARVFTYTLQPFQLFSSAVFLYLICAMASAAVRKRPGALLNGAAALLLIAAVMNDMLFYNAWVGSADLAPFGVMLFLFVQTLIVARTYGQAFDRAESVSAELQAVNDTLEERIIGRTRELESSRRSLAEANERITEANARLLAAEASRLRLLGNISHELATPMTAVQGYLRAMLDGIVDKRDTSYLHRIHQKMLMMNRLVGDLFELSKLESGQALFQKSFIAVGDWFGEHVAQCGYDVQSAGLMFALEAPSPLPQLGTPLLSLDVHRMQQVIGNLVYNAIKHTPAGGTIRIAGRLAADPNRLGQGALTVEVRDTGTGIDASELPHIFDRFFKGSGSGQDGTGLGLCIVREIVSKHGGDIGVESQAGHGAVFRFTLPVEYIAGEAGR